MTGSETATETGCPSDRGSGTVVALGLVAAVLTLLLSLLLLGAAVAARHRASVAADLAALAAADVVLGRADGSPCSRAAEVAGAQQAHLDACVVSGDTVTVRVSAVPRGVAASLGKATARARAGAASAGPGPDP